MVLHSFFIVNKSGGLIFDRELTPGARLGGNDKLLLASTFHSLHAISKQLAPVPGGGGISQVDAPAFSLHCLETPTGVKFFVTARPRTEGVGAFLRAAYVAYADALKSPFYEIDMPIRMRLFDHAIDTQARSLGLVGAAAAPSSAPLFTGSSGAS